MPERSIIKDKIKRKEAEVASLERKLDAAKVYLQALNDILKAVDKATGEEPVSETMLRKGSSVSQARDVILEFGKPIHIDDLLNRLGRNVTRENKASLTSSLAAYVRRDEIFTRPAPNTFGLIELGHTEAEEEPEDSSLPEGFGTIQSDRTDDEIPF